MCTKLFDCGFWVVWAADSQCLQFFKSTPLPKPILDQRCSGGESELEKNSNPTKWFIQPGGTVSALSQSQSSFAVTNTQRGRRVKTAVKCKVNQYLRKLHECNTFLHTASDYTKGSETRKDGGVWWRNIENSICASCVTDRECVPQDYDTKITVRAKDEKRPKEKHGVSK